MREIKFRAWVNESPDKEIYQSKKMYGWDVVVDDCNWFIKCNDLQQDSFYLMQYTGLKDKNGVEIYEGDIVRIKDHAQFTGEGVVRDYKVNERSGCFMADWIKNGSDAPNGVEIWDTKVWHKLQEGVTLIEVIGNVYENPELLLN